MEIKQEDITLERFLKFFKPALDPTIGKIELSNADFLLIASVLKLNRTFEMGKTKR